MIFLLKLTGLLLLLCACAAAGFFEAYKLRMRVEFLESFLRFVTACQAEIQCCAIPVRG